ncbi:MAG: hypothetical protein QOE91_1271 [Gaiellaceae bacterium]|nr:hypothetical protein [Gaiellaceae bacterium]
MQAQELKSLVESGLYKPDPSQVALAMLQRRGVRDLLVDAQPTAMNGSSPVSGSADRGPAAQAVPRQAA